MRIRKKNSQVVKVYIGLFPHWCLKLNIWSSCLPCSSEASHVWGWSHQTSLSPARSFNFFYVPPLLVTMPEVHSQACQFHSHYPITSVSTRPMLVQCLCNLLLSAPENPPVMGKIFYHQISGKRAVMTKWM